MALLAVSISGYASLANAALHTGKPGYPLPVVE